ncbi:MAG: hypothetical protein H0X51_08705 [Parachlamydiaceae bacterium]|nr:hypothetical protein [Parachlamydiaceae bacterium]
MSVKLDLFTKTNQQVQVKRRCCSIKLVFNVFLHLANFFLRLMHCRLYQLYENLVPVTRITLPAPTIAPMEKRDAGGKILSSPQEKEVSQVAVVQVPAATKVLETSQLSLVLTEPVVKMPSLGVAQTTELGNKGAGLVKVEELLKKEKLAGVSIPARSGLSHQQVEAFLKQTIPEIFVKWDELAEECEKLRKENQEIHLECIQETLEDIQKKIITLFDKVSKQQQGNPFEGINEWLEGIRKQGSYLMVRSSGVEDSVEVVNAGGNLSESYVEPRMEAILSSCGRVIASYFGIASLKNQLLANTNPFKSLALSVLFQELVGEIPDNKDASKLPVSVVLFTTEPNFSEPGFSVTTISCSFGHGEGVVNSKNVNCDTAYVVASSADRTKMVEMYQTISKPLRLAPKRRSEVSVALEEVANDLEIVRERALNPKMVQRLVELGRLVEAHNGFPTDMELVIKGEEIYIVQARPIVRPKTKPNHLSDLRLSELEQERKVSVEAGYVTMLTSGCNSVEEITSFDQILFCNTLQDALREYKKNQHRFIVVNTKEPANSHPTIMFRSMGIISVFHPEWRDMKKMAKQLDKTNVLLVCPQSGRFCLMPKQAAGAVVQRGYFSHPAKMNLSMETPRYPVRPLYVSKNSEPELELQKLIRALKESTTGQMAAAALKQIRETHLTSIERNLKSLYEKIAKSKTNLPHILGALEQLERIQACVQKALLEIEACFKESRSRMETLFHIETLSALCTRPREETQYAVSLLHGEPLLLSTNKLLKYQEQLAFQTQLEGLVHIGEYALTREDEDKWESFLIGLEKSIQTKELSAEEVGNFREILECLERTESTALWFTFHFMIAEATEKSPLLVLRSLLKGFDQDTRSVVTQALHMKHSIDSLRTRLNDFAHPQTFESAWKRLQGLSLFFKENADFLKTMDKGSHFSKMINTLLMGSYVEVMDQAIKTMQGSRLHRKIDKGKLFGQMLQVNLSVLKMWLYKILKGHCDINHKWKWNLRRYVEEVLEASLKTYGDYPSEDFNVLATRLGSLVDYERHMPRTKGDLFTLIHQNQLYVLEVLTLWLMPSEISLPTVMQVAHQSYKTWLIGAEFGRNGARFLYNTPLAHHSVAVQLQCRRSEQEVGMCVQFYGENRDRWVIISELVRLFNDSQILLSRSPPQYDRYALSFNWRIRTLKEQELAFKLLEAFKESTIDSRSSSWLEGQLRGILRKSKQMPYLTKWLVVTATQTARIGSGWFHREVEGFLISEEGKSLLNTIAAEYGHSDRHDETEKEFQMIERIADFIKSVPIETATLDLNATDDIMRVMHTTLPRFIEKLGEARTKVAVNILQKNIKAMEAKQKRKAEKEAKKKAEAQKEKTTDAL